MALPFLPYETIAATFIGLKTETMTEPLPVAVYQLNAGKLDSQDSLAPKCWSVFMQSIRTNNDIEGRYHSLNRRAAG